MRRSVEIPDGARFLTQRQAAAYLGCPRSRFRAAVDAGDAPAAVEVLPGLYRWDRLQLDAFADRRCAVAGDTPGRRGGRSGEEELLAKLRCPKSA